MHFADPEKIKEYTVFFRNELDIELVLEPDAEIFGIDPNNTKLLNICHDSLQKVFRKYNSNEVKRIRKSLKKLSELPQQIRELPFFELVSEMMQKNLKNIENESDTEQEYLHNEFIEKFPQHPVSKIMETQEKFRLLLQSESGMIEPLFRIRDYFGDRKKIHIFEFRILMSLYEYYIIEKGDVNILCAFDELIVEKKPDDLIAKQLTVSLFNIQESVLWKKLELDK